MGSRSSSPARAAPGNTPSTSHNSTGSQQQSAQSNPNDAYYQQRFYPQQGQPPASPAPHPYQVGLTHNQWLQSVVPVRIVQMHPRAQAPPPPPPPPPAKVETATRVRNDVQLRNDSLHLSHIRDSKWSLKFTVHAQAECLIQVLFGATEFVDQENNSIRFEENLCPRSQCRQLQLPAGPDKVIAFDSPEDALDLSGLSDMQLSHFNGTSYYPLIIVLTRLPGASDDGNTQYVQKLITYITIKRNSAGDRSLQIIRQKAQVNHKSFVLEEIYGLDAAQHEGSSDCVVCLSAQCDTTIYPCRHMVLCSECADSLRLQGRGAKCPVCRTQIEHLLKLQVK